MGGVGPLAESGLDKAFGFAVSLRRVRAGVAVLQAHLLASAVELMGAVTAAVVGEQSADADAVASEEVDGIAQKSDGGVGFLIGQDLGESHAGVIVDGDVQRPAIRDACVGRGGGRRPAKTLAGSGLGP